MQGRWSLVRVARGPAVLAWLDGSRWRGWIIPWFPDASMEAIGALYFTEDPERAPWQAQSGEFVYTNDADEFVRLDRHRRTVAVDGRRGAMALSDAAAMSWCWEEAPPDDVAIRAALAAIADDLVETRTSRRAKRSRRRTKSR